MSDSLCDKYTATLRKRFPLGTVIASVDTIAGLLRDIDESARIDAKIEIIDRLNGGANLLDLALELKSNADALQHRMQTVGAAVPDGVRS